MPTHCPRANPCSLHTQKEVNTTQKNISNNKYLIIQQVLLQYNIPADDSNPICNLFILYNPLKDSTNQHQHLFYFQFFMTPLLR